MATKLTPKIVAAMRTERRRGMSFREMARLANVSDTCVHNAVMGVRWTRGVPVPPISPAENELIKRRFGIARPSLRKLSAQQVREIRRRYEAGEPQGELARTFGVPQSGIHAIVNRITYRDVFG